MPVSPPSISGILGFWDAGNITASDNDPVSSWADASGNGGPTFTASTTARPTYKTAIVNSQPALLFDGSTDVLVADASLAGIKTIVAIAAYIPATFNSYDALVTGSSSAAGNVWLMGRPDAGHTTELYQIDGKTWYINGVQTVLNACPGWKAFISSEATARTHTLKIGYDRIYANRHWDGYVACVMAFDHVLDSTERNTVQAWAVARYAIASPQTYTFNSYGGAVAGGAASWKHTVTEVFAPIGGAVAGGGALFQSSINALFEPSGGAVAGGSSPFTMSDVYPLVPYGGAIAGGSSAWTVRYISTSFARTSKSYSFSRTDVTPRFIRTEV
jgi:hypothetical protein